MQRGDGSSRKRIIDRGLPRGFSCGAKIRVRTDKEMRTLEIITMVPVSDVIIIKYILVWVLAFILDLHLNYWRWIHGSPFC
jgi:hypothetical protein